jgi:fumarate reductase subunit C
MDVALLVVSAILASEVALRLPLLDQVTAIVGTARRSAATVRSRRISDHWKEAVLPAYSARMAGRSFYFFLLLCLVLLPVALVGLAAPGGMTHWLDYLMQPLAIAILCICSIAYILVRTRTARG